MAKIIINARLTGDSRLREVETKNGKRKILDYAFADMNAPEGVNPFWNGNIWSQPRTDGELSYAEKMEKYLKKGTVVNIIGDFYDVRTFTKKDGTTAYSKDVSKIELTLMGSRTTPAAGAGDENTASQTPDSGNNGGDGFMNIPDGVDEELPF